jgi:hypothetical protein
MRAVIVVGLSMLAASVASAQKLVEAHAAARAGVATGNGIGGAQKDHDFFSGAKGGTYGLEVGVKVLMIDTRITHDRFVVGGTWTQLVIGPRIAFPAAGGLYADIGAAAGFGVGTGQPIMGSLSNDEITDKGIMVELHAALDYRFEIFGLGVMIPLGWGYMFKNGVPANDTSNHYTTFRAALLGTLTVRLGL